MAQTRQQIAEIIESLRVGDAVVVVWQDANSQARSTEAGGVWQPTDNDYLGLGPDLLDPEDTELINITVVSRAPVTVSQPPVGAVAVFSRLPLIGQQKSELYVYKRTTKGWQITGSAGTIPWSLISGAWGAPLQVFLPGAVPAAPTLVSLTAGDGRIVVSATLNSPGSSPVINVEYQLIFAFSVGDQESTAWIPTGQATGNFTIPNLENGVSFSVKIRAVNASGASTRSNLLSAVPFGPAGPPSTPTATAGNAQVSLSWNAPQVNGGASITGYKIEKITGSDNTGWATVISNTESPATTYTATGLANGTALSFRVTAINQAGTGTPSGSSSAVTPTAA